jgi:hypothetical protein
VWPPATDVDVQIFDRQNNEFIRFPLGPIDPIDNVALSRDADGAIDAGQSPSPSAKPEPAIPGKRPHTLWLVLLAVLLVETTYLGIHLVGDWRQAQSLASPIDHECALLQQAAALPPYLWTPHPPRAMPAMRPQALEAGASAMPRSIAPRATGSGSGCGPSSRRATWRHLNHAADSGPDLRRRPFRQYQRSRARSADGRTPSARACQ